MARSEGFDEEAMERKIKKNLEAKFTLKEILILLMEEQKAMLEQMRIREARVVELSDQIDYIQEKYADPLGLHS